jgi:hypothetical protein
VALVCELHGCAPGMAVCTGCAASQANTRWAANVERLLLVCVLTVRVT